MAGGWVVLGLLLCLMSVQPASGLGVNWGTISLNPLPPTNVARLLVANGIKKVKFFDAAYDAVSSLAGTGIEVMVAAPNEMLKSLAVDPDFAKKWVKQNVTGFPSVDIKYALTLTCSFTVQDTNSVRQYPKRHSKGIWVYWSQDAARLSILFNLESLRSVMTNCAYYLL